MGDIFLKILSMSINAGWIVLAVLIIRLLLKKAPKWITVLLWGVVALRLLIPFSFESFLSLLPSKEVISTSAPAVTQNVATEVMPNIDTGVSLIDYPVNEFLGESFSANNSNSENFIDVVTIIAIVWLVGIAVMLVYSVISYIKLRKKVVISLCKEKNVYYCDNINTPFILGILKPKIYIPSSMDETDIDYVLSHEEAHIKRKDYLWKPLGFLLLSVHWFNPLLWVAYGAFCRDIELATDEKAIKNMKREEKIAYSNVLVNCSINQKIISANPLSFGEISVKDRIKNIVSYKKPTVWVMILIIIVCSVFTVGFLTDPPTKDDSKFFEKFFPSSNEDFEDKVVTSTTTTVTGGETQGKTEDGKETVSKVTSSPTLNNPSKEQDKVGDLNKNTVRKIKQDYLNSLENSQNYKIDDIVIRDYYGTFSDGSIALKIGISGVLSGYDASNTWQILYANVECMHLEEYTFHPRHFYPQIYKDSQILYIDTAYKKGLISKKVLDEIFDKYPEYNKSDDYFTQRDNFGNLNKDVFCKIKQQYYTKLNGDYKTYGAYKLFEYCDIYMSDYYKTLKNGYVVVVLKYDKDTGKEKELLEKVGNYNYKHQINQGVYLFKNTSAASSLEAIDLVTAYKQKLITDTQLDGIFNCYPEFYGTVDND